MNTFILLLCIIKVFIVWTSLLSVLSMISLGISKYSYIQLLRDYDITQSDIDRKLMRYSSLPIRTKHIITEFRMSNFKAIRQFAKSFIILGLLIGLHEYLILINL